MKKLISIFLIIIGILLILYPIIGRILSKFNQSNVIEKYKEKVIQMEDDEKEKIKKRYDKDNSDNVGELIGYIEIEKINVYMPIYEGSTDKILLKGIGHIEYTKLPTLKSMYNSVFVGHSGMTSKIFFDDLDKLEINDEFSITILNQIYKYKIKDIKTVFPNEAETITQNRKNKKNTATLITCTPKYINSHRLLVIGEELEQKEKD